MMTPEEKAKRKAERAEAKRIEADRLDQQVRKILEKRKSTIAQDSAMRGTLKYNAWQRGQITGQRFRGHCGR